MNMLSKLPVMNASDLQYLYSPSAIKGDNPHLVGFPDNVLLNRNERYEVLGFINRFLANNDLYTVADGKKVERMIRVVPKELHSHLHINNWIVANWKNYN